MTDMNVITYEHFRCPACGDDGPFTVYHLLELEVDADGAITDPVDPFDWGPDDDMRCDACGNRDTVDDFAAAGEPE